MTSSSSVPDRRVRDARELAGHEVSAALVEARADVGDGTSKANTAILHTGFDAKPGTLGSAMVARGYHLLSEYAGRAAFPSSARAPSWWPGTPNNSTPCPP